MPTVAPDRRASISRINAGKAAEMINLEILALRGWFVCDRVDARLTKYWVHPPSQTTICSDARFHSANPPTVNPSPGRWQPESVRLR